MAHHHETDEIEDAKNRARQSRKHTEMGGRFKAPEGKTTLRVLETPPDKERNSPALYIEYQQHNNVGPNKRFARCGNELGSSKRRCWLCRKADKLEKEGRTKEAAKLRPQLMLAVQVAVLDKDTNEMVGPLLWEMSSGKSAQAMGYKIRGIVSSDKRNYTDHKHGYNIDIRRQGSGLQTKWGDIDHDEKSSKVPKGILKQLKPFVDAGLSSYNEEWQKNAYYGRDNQEDNSMAAKKKGKKVEEELESDASASASGSDASSSDASSSDASSSDASSSDASSSDASSSDASSSDASSKKTKKKKKEESDSDASSSDASSSDSDSSSSDSDASASASGSDASSSDASSSDASSSDASSSDASSSDASSSDTDEKPAKGKKGKAKKTRKPRAAKKGKGKGKK